MLSIKHLFRITDHFFAQNGGGGMELIPQIKMNWLTTLKQDPLICLLGK